MPPVRKDSKLKNVGKVPGIEIWRINKFELEPVPKEFYGNFYTGDSYIVMLTKGASEWNIHFWLGKDTTHDEWGTAAMKAVEIDDSLGGIPVQYREVQEHESALFLSYFKNNLKYLQGGYESGFNQVRNPYENFKPRLFHVKGKRNVRCTQVTLGVESLNKGDVFILDEGFNIYVWMTPETGRLERIKGMELANSIKNQERGGRPKIHIVDGGWNTHVGFWKHFGGVENVKKLKSSQEGGHDLDYWRDNKEQLTLWRVTDSKGELEVTQVRKGDLEAKLLDSNDAFILDAVRDGIYVWIGKNCTDCERKNAMLWAQQYLEKQNRPAWTQVMRVIENAEPSTFTQWFVRWDSSSGKKSVAFTPKLFQVSNESGKMHVEEIAEYSQEDLDGDDVMMLDVLDKIYVWIGTGANQEERKHAEEAAKKYLATDSIPRPKKASTKVIKQKEEPPDFKKNFKTWYSKRSYLQIFVKEPTGLRKIVNNKPILGA